MIIRRSSEIKPSEITDRKTYLSRRRFLKKSLNLGITGTLLPVTTGGLLLHAPDSRAALSIGKFSKSPYSTQEKPTDHDAATGYNNFYEFGTDKEDPAKNSGSFHPYPWSIEISGECEKPGVFQLEDFVKPYALQERIYRLRCVEGWSMVIPWLGMPLGDVLKRFNPNSNARYVAFTTVYRPAEMPGQKWPVLKWPYVEGLRIDEAMHPLTILSVGIYGDVLPNQNGAPVRLVVPWKYGFKSIKSIVKISFTRSQPPTSWNIATPNEYGFYSNVNPHVDHPRWSQRRERRIGDFLKRDTLMFNGYEAQVASLYRGMDLKKYF